MYRFGTLAHPSLSHPQLPRSPPAQSAHRQVALCIVRISSESYEFSQKLLVTIRFYPYIKKYCHRSMVIWELILSFRVRCVWPESLLKQSSSISCVFRLLKDKNKHSSGNTKDSAVFLSLKCGSLSFVLVGSINP